MRLQGILAVLATVTCVIIQRSWQQKTCDQGRECHICDLLNRRSILRSGILRNEPSSIVTTIDRDQESSATFACEAEWINRPLNNRSRLQRFCDFVDLNLESVENLTSQLGLSLEWEIDGIRAFNSTEALTPALKERGIVISTTRIFKAERLFDILVGGENYCKERITSDLIPHWTSIISITRQAANSNVQLQCLVRPLQCVDDRFLDTSSRVYLQLQGLLNPPPGLRVEELNSTTLYLSWNPPSTLNGVPISHYSVHINNLVTVSTVTVVASMNQPSIDPNMTSLDLSRVGSIGYLYDPSCESIEFTVRAWNSVGEGASSTVVYSQESLRNMKAYTALQSLGTLCVLCEFNVTTEAQGCQASIQEVVDSQTSTTTRTVLNMTLIRTHWSLTGGQNSIIEAFDCISGLQTGNYTVSVREIECSGGIGLRAFMHSSIRVDGLDKDPEVSTCAPGEAAQGTRANTQTIGFSVAIVILITIGVLLLVMIIVVVKVRKPNNNSEVILKGHQATPSSQPSSNNSQQHNPSHEQELLYDNDYNVRPITGTNTNIPVPTTEYTYTAVTHPRQLRPKMNSVNNNGIEMNSCVAYGTTT